MLAPGVVVFSKTETEKELELGTAISNFPSPLRSPTDTERGKVPVGKSVFKEKVGMLAPGEVVFRNTEIVEEL